MGKAIPVCPMLSVGHQTNLICIQENCAWYMKNYKTCCVYILAHNAALDIKEKQNKLRNKV